MRKGNYMNSDSWVSQQKNTITVTDSTGKIFKHTLKYKTYKDVQNSKYNK